MDSELQRKIVAFEDDRQMDDVLGEFGMGKDLAVFKSSETSPERSPRAISPLNIIEDTEVEENVRAEIRKRIPTGKGREFEVQMFKDIRTNGAWSLCLGTTSFRRTRSLRTLFYL